jgi:glycerol-3-phosphate O-acyltransferase
VPSGLGVLASTLSHGLSLPDRQAVNERMAVDGKIDHVRQLAEAGTLVFVCPHFSRMDAAFMGLAMHLADLPPLIHGADQNLFDNPITAFFMSNLGAYRVDRSLKHTLYKEVLKTYSQVLIERGYHSFFFPAGGRTRTNQLPQSLKLGLLGTALDAYTQNVLQRKNDRVFVVPVTINYNLVLEAETLIEDFLEVKGFRQEVIDKDEFSDPLRIAAYFRALTVLDEMVNVQIGTPMDVFGNRVNQRGESINESGKVVDPQRYVWEQGRPTADRERAHAYTRGLGRKVIEGFKRNNVIAPIHIVSLALFEHVCRQHPSWDVERLLWFAKGDVISRAVAEGETERVARLVRRDANAGKLRLTETAEHWSAREMVDEALKLYGGYPENPIVELHGRQLRLADLRLLYYYSNRLRHYDLERRLSSNPGGY